MITDQELERALARPTMPGVERSLLEDLHLERARSAAYDRDRTRLERERDEAQSILRAMSRSNESYVKALDEERAKLAEAEARVKLDAEAMESVHSAMGVFLSVGSMGYEGHTIDDRDPDPGPARRDMFRDLLHDRLRAGKGEEAGGG